MADITSRATRHSLHWRLHRLEHFLCSSPSLMYALPLWDDRAPSFPSPPALSLPHVSLFLPPIPTKSDRCYWKPGWLTPATKSCSLASRRRGVAAVAGLFPCCRCRCHWPCASEACLCRSCLFHRPLARLPSVSRRPCPFAPVSSCTPSPASLRLVNVLRRSVPAASRRRPLIRPLDRSPSTSTSTSTPTTTTPPPCPPYHPSARCCTTRVLTSLILPA